MNMIESRMEQRGQGGFTLIELLVVIAILAVLGGAVIIGIGSLRETAEAEVCNTEEETISLAAVAYDVAENGTAASIGVLEADGFLQKVDTDRFTLAGDGLSAFRVTGGPCDI